MKKTEKAVISLAVGIITLLLAVVTVSASYIEDRPLLSESTAVSYGELEAPTYSVTPLSFTYDGAVHPLEIEDISHPRMDEGAFSYRWYKDGELISVFGSRVDIKSVSDSGIYKCEITFFCGGESVAVETPDIPVTVFRREIEIPRVEPKVYNGEYQTPPLYSISLYTVDSCGGTEVGIYPIKITLKDSENHVFSSGEAVAYVDFEIKRAENYWIEDITVSDAYLGGAPSFCATARFGNAELLFSKYADGGFSSELPNEAGAYYARAYVCGNENYRELYSPVVQLNILSDSVEQLFIISLARRQTYSAFEVFDASGICIGARYLSGRIDALPADSLLIEYQSAQSFRYGDVAVNISYAGLTLVHPVRVFKAEYDMSCVEIADSAFIYDEETHYPRVEGSLPVGLDGSSPTYTFSSGVTNVSEGCVSVTVYFLSGSENYSDPPSVTVNVEILPKEIEVIWENLSFVYTGSISMPTAVSEASQITVSGGEADVGVYVAYATAADTNYRVTNSECRYEILKAENSWRNAPDIQSIFSSGSLAPVGESEYGKTEYIFRSGENIISAPTAVGEYFFKARSEGDKNHNAIESDWIAFSIIAVVPVNFSVELTSNEFFTLDRLSDTDTYAYVENNDGSTLEIPISDIAIAYQSADGFRMGDVTVSFSYMDFLVTRDITVKKRSYDLSKLSWSGLDFVYNGEPREALLFGVPEGIEILCYEGNRNTDAGKYTVSVRFTYDSENYIEPEIPSAVMRIEKRVVPVPSILSLEYNSLPQSPTIVGAELCEVEITEASEVGFHPIKFTLKDAENNVFENGTGVAVGELEIYKRKITVRISDIEIYLFSKGEEPNFEVVSGSLIEGEPLECSFSIGEESVSADFTSSNYDVTVISGRVYRYSRLSPDDSVRAFGFFIIILLLFMSLIFVFVNRRRISQFYREKFLVASGEFIPSKPEVMPSSYENNESIPPSEPHSHKNSDKRIQVESICESETTYTDSTESIGASVIDADYADRAITDSLAKDLLRRDIEIITEGRRKGIINIDTLSRSFNAGDKIDVNLMKEKRLIPYDTAYIKVLARGIIDKPLDIYANDFSLTAVKMIVLSGGKAIKVGKGKNTKRKNV